MSRPLIYTASRRLFKVQSGSDRSISRGYKRDISDVEAMYEQKLFSIEKLRECFEAVEPKLLRFPAIDSKILKNRVEDLINQLDESKKQP